MNASRKPTALPQPASLLARMLLLAITVAFAPAALATLLLPGRATPRPAPLEAPRAARSRARGFDSTVASASRAARVCTCAAQPPLTY
jgi:hypothetical protein